MSHADRIEALLREILIKLDRALPPPKRSGPRDAADVALFARLAKLFPAPFHAGDAFKAGERDRTLQALFEDADIDDARELGVVFSQVRDSVIARLDKGNRGRQWQFITPSGDSDRAAVTAISDNTLHHDENDDAS